MHGDCMTAISQLWRMKKKTAKPQGTKILFWSHRSGESSTLIIWAPLGIML